MKVLTIDDFAAFIGIDWADKKHDICEIATTTLKNTASSTSLTAIRRV